MLHGVLDLVHRAFSSYIEYHASCLVHLVYRATLIVYRASRAVHRATCIVHRVVFIEHPVSYLLRRASLS